MLSHFNVLPRVSPSCPTDDPKSPSMNTQLPLGYFPGTQSHISQAIAEVGDLELRRGMIWEAPSATGPHGTAQEGPLPRVGWVRVCEVSELAGIS